MKQDTPTPAEREGTRQSDPPIHVGNVIVGIPLGRGQQ